MAYTTEELEKAALEAIEKEKLVFVDEIMAFMPCCYATYYNHELEKLDTIKKAVNKNKIEIKHGIRKDWAEEGNATEKVALYKILGNEDERDALNGSSKPHDNGPLQLEIIDKTIKKKEGE